MDTAGKGFLRDSFKVVEKSVQQPTLIGKGIKRTIRKGVRKANKLWNSTTTTSSKEEQEPPTNKQNNQQLSGMEGTHTTTAVSSSTNSEEADATTSPPVSTSETTRTNLPIACPDPESTTLTEGVVDSTKTHSPFNQPLVEDDCSATPETTGVSSSDHALLLEQNSVSLQPEEKPEETEETRFHKHQQKNVSVEAMVKDTVIGGGSGTTFTTSRILGQKMDRTIRRGVRKASKLLGTTLAKATNHENKEQSKDCNNNNGNSQDEAARNAQDSTIPTMNARDSTIADQEPNHDSTRNDKDTHPKEMTEASGIPGEVNIANNTNSVDENDDNGDHEYCHSHHEELTPTGSENDPSPGEKTDTLGEVVLGADQSPPNDNANQNNMTVTNQESQDASSLVDDHGKSEVVIPISIEYFQSWIQDLDHCTTAPMLDEDVWKATLQSYQRSKDELERVQKARDNASKQQSSLPSDFESLEEACETAAKEVQESRSHCQAVAQSLLQSPKFQTFLHSSYNDQD